MASDSHCTLQTVKKTLFDLNPSMGGRIERKWGRGVPKGDWVTFLRTPIPDIYSEKSVSDDNKKIGSENGNFDGSTSTND